MDKNKEQLKKLNEKEMQDKVAELRKDLFRARLTAASSSSRDVSSIKKLKRDIARGLTYLRQKGIYQ